MWRVLILVTSSLLLSACATQNYRYYGSDYYRSAPAESAYADSGYSSTTRIGVNYYDYPDWVESPYYYSLFWDYNRHFVDPFWHPHFYYGVTWFPRNYYSVSYRYFPSRYYRHGRPFFAYLSYSPYRYAWVDYYYDWYPWYVRYPPLRYNNYYAPRYGNSRNEAERLARLNGLTRNQRRLYDQDGYYSRGWDQNQTRREVIADREAVRGADHYSRSGRRVDPGVSGFARGDNPRSGRNEADYRGPSAGRRGADHGDSPSRRELSSGGSIDDRRSPQFDTRSGPRSPSREASTGDAPRSSVSRGEVGGSRRALEAGIPYPDRSVRSPVYSTGTPRYSAPPRSDVVTPRRESFSSSESGRSSSREASSFSSPRETMRYSPPPSPPPSYSAPPRESNSSGNDYGRSAERSAPRFERSEPPARPEPVERVDSGSGSRGEARRFRDED